MKSSDLWTERETVCLREESGCNKFSFMVGPKRHITLNPNSKCICWLSKPNFATIFFVFCFVLSPFSLLFLLVMNINSSSQEPLPSQSRTDGGSKFNQDQNFVLFLGCPFWLAGFNILFCYCRDSLPWVHCEFSKFSTFSPIFHLILCNSSSILCLGVFVCKFIVQVQGKAVKRLCRVHNIITVNGQFPGPTLEVRDGDSLVIKVVNAARYNVSLHW